MRAIFRNMVNYGYNAIAYCVKETIKYIITGIGLYIYLKCITHHPINYSNNYPTNNPNYNPDYIPNYNPNYNPNYKNYDNDYIRYDYNYIRFNNYIPRDTPTDDNIPNNSELSPQSIKLALKKLGITDRKSFKKWAIVNHPDKQANKHHDNTKLFGMVSHYVDIVYPK